MKQNNLSNNKEYQEIICKLEYIQSQKELLENMSKTDNYNAHVKLPGTFEELIINLKRENDTLERQINFEKKKIINFLSEKNVNDKETINNSINSIIYSIEDHTINNELTDFYSNELKNFYHIILDLVSKIDANNLLLKQIYNLQKEKDELLSKKSALESTGFFDLLKSTFRSK